MNRKFKRAAFIVIEIFCNIINYFTVTLVKVRVNRKFATVFTSVLWRTSEINIILNEEIEGIACFSTCELIWIVVKLGVSFRTTFLLNNTDSWGAWLRCPAQPNRQLLMSSEKAHHFRGEEHFKIWIKDYEDKHIFLWIDLHECMFTTKIAMCANK